MNRPCRVSGGRFPERHCTPVVSGTALHTGRLPEPYRCAGRTRNRLTINYLIITAARAFLNARLRQCPNSNSLLTALFAASAVVHIHIATATLPVKHFHRAPPATPEAPATHHQLPPKPGDSPTALFPASATNHTGPTPPAPLLDRQPGSGAGTAAGIYDLRRLKFKHCAEPLRGSLRA